MNLQRTAIIVAAAVVIVLGGTWLFLPSLQSGQKRVENEALVHLERARRLLDRYSADLVYQGLVLEQLKNAEVPLDPKDVSEATDEIGDDYQAAHQAFWAAFEPKEWNEGTGRPVKANYGNLASQMRDGITARSALVKENVALLDEVLKEIDEAVRVEAGGATGAEVAEANRLKGVALYHRGVVEQVTARVKRDEIAPVLKELTALAAEAEQLKALEGVLSHSRVDEQIGRTRQELGRAEERLTAARTELSKLDATIANLDQKVAAAKTKAKGARTEIDRLRAMGVDFSDPQGANTFARKLGEQYTVYRSALKEVQELEAGSLPKASIDISGDFLRGRYLEGGSKNLTVEPGLYRHRLERAALAARIKHEEDGVEAIRQDLARLESGRKPYEELEARAAQRLPEIQKEAATAYEELSRLDSEAEAIEERGLKFFDLSAAASQQGATLAEKWAADGREASSTLAPEAQERSAFKSRSDDGWLAGSCNAQAGDARSAKAWIFYDRYNAATRIASTLERLTDQIALREVDVAAARAKADASKAASIREIELAIAALEKAHKSTAGHWTLAAQSAGITYLMVLLGHEDYLADAIAGYQNAVKSRESEPAAEQFVSRLRVLEARQP